MPRAPGENPYANPDYIAGSLPVPAAPGNPQTPASPQQDVQELEPGPQMIELPDDGRTGVIVKYTSCGGTDTRCVVEVRSLVCANRRPHYNEPHLEGQMDLTRGIQDLEDTVMTHSLQNLTGQSTVILKCTDYGVEMAVDTHETVQMHCHWCRSHLSPNSRISNGATPDVMTPFLVLQHGAAEIIREFVNQRKFYAHPRFKQEFAPENVVGVCLSCLVLDGQAHGDLTGRGEV